MAEITLQQRLQALSRRVRGRQGDEPGDRRRRVHDPGRPVRVREVDGAADGRGAGGDHRRRADHRRPARQRPRAARSRHRDGVPELRAVSAHDGAREHGLRAQALEGLEVRDRREGQARGGDPRAAGPSRPQAGEAVRRPAPAGRDGARDRARSEGVPDGRAALEPRREAARADAHAGGADPEPARHHDALRHPRPDRGDDARRPGGGDARGRDPAGRSARRRSTTSPRTCSWPGSSGRRR